MKLSLLTFLVGSLVAASTASATVTLQFSLPPGVVNGGFVGAGGETSGLAWGVVIDTAGDGFASTYDPGFALSSGSIFGGLGNDLLWMAPGATLSAFGTDGVITAVTNIPIGANAGGSGLTTAAGNPFAIVWFDAGIASGATTVGGDTFGMLTDAGFTLPPDGTTGGGYESNPIFDGSTRPADTVLVPEPSVALLGMLGLLGFARRRR